MPEAQRQGWNSRSRSGAGSDLVRFASFKIPRTAGDGALEGRYGGLWTLADRLAVVSTISSRCRFCHPEVATKNNILGRLSTVHAAQEVCIGLSVPVRRRNFSWSSKSHATRYLAYHAKIFQFAKHISFPRSSRSLVHVPEL
jgi:hypothetical protein